MIITSKDAWKVNSGRFLVCGDCGELIGIMSKESDDYRINYICACGGFSKNVKKSTAKSRGRNISGGHLYVMDNDYICPCCGRMLFRIMRSRIQSMAFWIKCSCGAEYTRAKPLRGRSRMLLNNRV